MQDQDRDRQTLLWPGLFDAEALNKDEKISETCGEMSRKFTYSGQKPFPFGEPLLIRSQTYDVLQKFSAAYHRMVLEIIRAYPHSSDLQAYLSMPNRVRHLLHEFGADASDARIQLCRLDLYPTLDGGFKVLETNANCPGGLIYAGYAARAFRPALMDTECVPMPYENPTWMADWYIRTTPSLHGNAPKTFLLLRPEGGHRLELDEHADAFRALGSVVVEGDPRDLLFDELGNAVTSGVVVKHGYHKISFVDLEKMGAGSEVYLKAVASGRLAVQNGIASRIVGDNKLCLAVMYESSFEHLFSADDLKTVRPHLAWAANVKLLDTDEIASIENNRRKFVLKRPLDTRGRGVLIGEECSGADWRKGLLQGIDEGWLVMDSVEPTQLPTASDGPVRHDIAVALVDGVVEGGYSRSSREYKVNVAQNGRLHPLMFMAS